MPEVGFYRRTAVVVLSALVLPLAAARPLHAQTGNRFMPFGPKQTPVTSFGQPPFTGVYVNAGTPERMQERLTTARRYGMRVVLALAPSHDSMLSPTTGCFDINLWKQGIDKLRSVDLAPYVTDGTLLGAEIVNEPHASDWCRSTPTRLAKNTVEEMLAYAKSIWPTVPMGCGRSDWVLANAPWRFLDFSHSQYHMRKGDIEAWRTTTVDEARRAGVGLLLSLNFLAGQLDDSAMTPEQLRQYGTALAREPYACMLTGYLSDAAYFSRPGVMEALNAIAAVAASHPAAPCYAGTSVRPAPGVQPRQPTNLRVVGR